MCLVLVSEVLVLEKELGIHDVINPASQDIEIRLKDFCQKFHM